jgi:hypothetical protein
MLDWLNMKPYTLTLFALRKPDTPEGIISSMQMNGYGLWQEFSLLPNVTLQYFPTESTEEIPQTDFALVHDCFDSPIYNRLTEIRAKTRRKIMGFMEIVFPSPLIDMAFSFLPTPWPDRNILKLPWPEVEQIRLPCIRSILDATALTAKFAGSILLDHGWIENGKKTDCLSSLYEWLEPMQSRTVGQLRRQRSETVPPPAWVHSIQEGSYPAYLAQTATYETFIVTHFGSYEHSIIDMAARGIRVLVSVVNGKPSCNPSMIEDLRLSTFSNREELLAILANLPPPSPMDKFTDIKAVVARIDAYAQENLP